MSSLKNIDRHTVDGFGAEWSTFDQSGMPDEERARNFAIYFHLFPWEALPAQPVGFDLGCGSGRWAREAAPRVGRLHCVDASPEALAVARRNLAARPNCEFHHASAGSLPFADASMDFGYSLGVLHHVPDTEAALADCARVLKRGAPLLVYLYYRFDNRPAWFRALWLASDVLRRGISRLPFPARLGVSQALAALVYFPLARTARLLERAGVDVSSFPLSAYRDASFYTMRTDSLDRFGTKLEKRYTRAEIRAMLTAAGFEGIRVSEGPPFWAAVGFKR